MRGSICFVPNIYIVCNNTYCVITMSYGTYRRYGRGLGLGPNLSPYCRWYPGMPRGWWADPAYASQTAFPQIQPTPAWPRFQNAFNQYPSPVAYGQASVFPPVAPQQLTPMMMLPRSNYTSPQPYDFGGGTGIGMGAGRGMGMQYRRGRGRFGRNAYQY